MSAICGTLSAGPLSFETAQDRIHTVCWHGFEVIRAVSAPLRDVSWGTIPETSHDPELSQKADHLNFTRAFTALDGKVQGSFSVRAEAAGELLVMWSVTANEDVEVNRAGLCVLHPLVGVEGTALTVTDPTDAQAETTFPAAISPAQPATGIASLEHDIFGVRVALAFTGETFEMEDQRNWSDASYKTYCRPLSAPRPYRIAEGETLTQTLTATFSGSPARALASAQDCKSVKLPELLWAVEPGWLAGELPTGAVLARFGQSKWSDADLVRLAGTPLDAEIVVQGDLAGELAHWAERFKQVGIAPRHVIALPKAYLQSYQPEGPWPDGPTPVDCIQDAAKAFPGARIGAGMLTNFTEFNRCPPGADQGAYITHANAAIVHAADDLSVLQTLEAMPAIFRSAQSIAAERAYRLGLCAIAMRSNPYGDGLSANPGGNKRTMTDDDPRQGTDFAAAYAIGMAALAASHGVEAISLAAPAGPFAATGPLADALSALKRFGSEEVQVSASAGRFKIEGKRQRVLANCTLYIWREAPGGPLDPAKWRVTTGDVA